MANCILAVNGDRLNERLTKLGGIGALEGGGVCRLALTDADKQGRDLVVSWMEALGLDIAVDAIGNVVGTLKGSEKLPAVMMGSHIDTVSTGGLFDGNLGVLAGLEVIETIIESGIKPRHPLAVGFFTNEEGSRFAPDMMGSGVYTGDLALDVALATVGIDGKTVGEELNRIGYQGSAPFPNVAETVAAYFELHVEQGPVLDEENIEIGVVEGVQGISWHEFTIHGNSNHAGTTPMSYRNDAGLVAAKVNVFVNELANSIPDQLATVGALEIKPNLVNVIPEYACFTVDLRNCDEQKLQQAEYQLDAYIAEQTEIHGLTFEKRKLARFEPVPFNQALVDGIEASAKENNLSSKRLYSGAGHDAQMFAPLCPTAMIFVPSVGGISHNIKEYTTPQQVTNGANVLLQAIAKQVF
jgi:N-carbamoyl-L-amino-acid hydrolase